MLDGYVAKSGFIWVCVVFCLSLVILFSISWTEVRRERESLCAIVAFGLRGNVCGR